MVLAFQNGCLQNSMGIIFALGFRISYLGN